MGKRADAETFIIKYIDKIEMGAGINVAEYKKKFSLMTDAEFDEFMHNLKTKKERLCFIQPNMKKFKIDIENNFAIADELGHDFFQRIWITTPDGLTYLTPEKYLVMQARVRRQGQLLSHKISVPENDAVRDHLTDQVTGDSKSAAISYPEFNVMAARGLVNCAEELARYRGGDLRGYNAMVTTLDREGTVSMKAIEPYSGGAKAVETFRNLLLSAHINNTLKQKQ